MIILVHPNSQSEFDQYLSVALAFAKIKNETGVEQKLSAIAQEIGYESEVPPSRIRVLNLTNFVIPTPPFPTKPFLARTLGDQSILNNIYWYLRDATTPNSLTIVLAPAGEPTVAQNLDAMCEGAKAKVAAWLKTTEGKSVTTTQERSTIKKLDGFDWWDKEKFDPRFIKSLALAVIKRKPISTVQEATQLHDFLYTKGSNISKSWATYLGYVNPFNNQTRAGKDDALLMR